MMFIYDSVLTFNNIFLNICFLCTPAVLKLQTRGTVQTYHVIIVNAVTETT